MRNLRTESTARCRRKPLAALLDEAHTLDLEVGRTLLNASQQVRADAPFLTYEELKSAVAAAHAAPGQVHAALNALQRLDFVWRPPGQLPPVRYQPGIPSLMEHVLDHAAPAPAGVS